MTAPLSFGNNLFDAFSYFPSSETPSDAWSRELASFEYYTVPDFRHSPHGYNFYSGNAESRTLTANTSATEAGSPVRLGDNDFFPPFSCSESASSIANGYSLGETFPTDLSGLASTALCGAVNARRPTPCSAPARPGPFQTYSPRLMPRCSQISPMKTQQSSKQLSAKVKSRTAFKSGTRGTKRKANSLDDRNPKRARKGTACIRCRIYNEQASIHMLLFLLN